MSHLRFTPAEYEALARVRRLDLRGEDIPAFRLLLSALLFDDTPELAQRILRLRDGEVRLIRDHLRARKRQSFTAEEWRAIAEACRILPATTRFARPVQAVLARHFRKASPGLARKLGRLSVTQFARVFEQVQYGRAEGA